MPGESIFQMLANQFLPPAAHSGGAGLEAPPPPDMMGIPNFSNQQENQFIDLGAGGPKPGTERGNFLSSLGAIAQQVAPMVGGAMSGSQAANAAAATRVAQTPGSATTAAFGLTQPRQSWGG